MISYAEKRTRRSREFVTCMDMIHHDLKSGLLLDLGCGGGYSTEHYLNLGIRVIGLEINKALENVKRRAPALELIHADGRWLPFRNATFHTIVTIDVLEHVPYSSAERLLTGIRRSLRNTGILYISVANRYEILEPHTLKPFLTWFPRSWWKAISRSDFDVCPYTVKGLKELCQKTGFSYEDFTWFYAREKLRDPDYIGSRNLRGITKLLRKIRVDRILTNFFRKFSVILFVCKKAGGTTILTNSRKGRIMGRVG